MCYFCWFSKKLRKFEWYLQAIRNTMYDSFIFVENADFPTSKVKCLVMYDCKYKVTQLVNSTTWFLRDSAASDTEAQPFKFWHLSQLHVSTLTVSTYENNMHTTTVKNCYAFSFLFYCSIHLCYDIMYFIVNI